jgi:hypothetical protein
MEKKLIGYVGVDSGQLMICDPCYIDSEWIKEPFGDIRIHKHKKTGRLFVYNSSKEIKKLLKNEVDEFFNKYNQKTSTGKTMNEMIADKEATDVIPIPEKLKTIGHFSYAGSCETTIANKHQLNYQAGHPGVAVVFNSGYGDGVYPVYGTFNAEGRCLKVEINCGMTTPQRNFFINETLKAKKAKTKKK